MQWLNGKVALVTGGASGIGKAVVKRFVSEGANVVVADIAKDRLRQMEDEIPEGIVTAFCDVTILEDNLEAVATAVRKFGRLDIFIGNAGIKDGGVELLDLTNTQIKTGFEQVFGVDVKGCLFGAKASAPELIKTNGNMIFTLSAASFYANRGGPIYVAAKHAEVGLVKELAYELAPKVRVNGVAPASTSGTNISHGEAFTSLSEKSSTPRRGRTPNPLGISLTPNDHEAAFVLLASDQARGITGQIIQVDGGLGVRGGSQVSSEGGIQRRTGV